MAPRTSDPGATHWDTIFSEHAEDAVSWFQADPSTSLRLVVEAAPDLRRPIVDVGAGESRLADALLAAGATDLTVLDVSRVALDAVAVRLGDSAGRVRFVCTGILDWTPDREFAVWHDRAVFHFLTEPADRDHYFRLAADALAPGGRLVLGTFGPDGPETCSGLPVCPYAPDELAALAARWFTLVTAEQELHRTPWGTEQPFTWVVLERR